MRRAADQPPTRARLRRRFALIIAALLISTAASGYVVWTILARDDAICRYARENRLAAIADVREQARILVDYAVADAERDGNKEREARIRTVTGPRFVAEQEREALRRHPPVNCDALP